MSNTVSKSMLNFRVDDLNDILGAPKTPFKDERDAQGRLIVNDGHYYLDWAYGGVRLVKMCEGGGCRDISPRGSKRETYLFIVAMIAGIEAEKELKK